MNKVFSDLNRVYRRIQLHLAIVPCDFSGVPDRWRVHAPWRSGMNEAGGRVRRYVFCPEHAGDAKGPSRFRDRLPARTLSISLPGPGIAAGRSHRRGASAPSGVVAL